ncbi:MAG: hypothetical protein IPP94_04405 [Ignavibacteria bacterium]|nr:hypothetical protein [Ignavibacteria bacterium]
MSGIPADTSARAAAPSLGVFFALLRAQRGVILRITLATTVLVTAYAFVMPQTYSSTVSVLPPKKEERGMGLADMLSGGSGAMEMFDLGSTLGFGGRPTDIFVKILGSRTVSDSMILNYRLQHFFGISPPLSWRFADAALKDATTIEATKDGMLTVTVSLSTGYWPSAAEVDSIKQLAADMANGYIRYLDVVNREKLVSTAKNSRMFIQEQLVRTKEDLDSAYTALVLYQESNRALMVDKQMDALVAAAGALKLQLAQATTELGLAQRDLTPGSRAVQDLQARVQQLQKQYGLLAAGDGSDTDFVLAFAKLPKIARDLSLLVRRVKTLEEVNAYLNKQFYKERVQEARELPTVQVLDEAVPAYKKTAPKRAQWMLTGFVFGLLGAILYVIGRDSATRLRNRRAAGSRAAGATP